MRGTTELFFKILCFASPKGEKCLHDSKNGYGVTRVTLYLIEESIIKKSVLFCPASRHALSNKKELEVLN